MPILRSYVETTLVRRLRHWLDEVGMSLSTDGTNSDLNDAVRVGLWRCGLSAADPAHVVDDDLSGLDGHLIDRLLDFAELRQLESIQSNLIYTKVDSASYSETKASLDQIVKDRRAEIMARHGGSIGVGNVRAGALAAPVGRDLWTLP
jgi:hypothetical protein